MPQVGVLKASAEPVVGIASERHTKTIEDRGGERRPASRMTADDDGLALGDLVPVLDECARKRTVDCRLPLRSSFKHESADQSIQPTVGTGAASVEDAKEGLTCTPFAFGRGGHCCAPTLHYILMARGVERHVRGD